MLAEGATGAIAQMAGQFGVTWPLLSAQILNFLLVAWLLYRFAFKPVLKSVEERKQKIADGLQYAEEMRLQLSQAQKHADDVLRKASDEAAEVVHEAREKSKAYIDAKTLEAGKKAEEMLKKAESVIAQEKQQMLGELKREVAQMVVETTQKVLDSSLTDKQRSEYVEKAAKELA